MTKKSEKRQSRLIIFIVVLIILIAIPVLLFRFISGSIVNKITQNISLNFSQELNEQMTAHISDTFDYYYQEMENEYSALKSIEPLDEERLRSFITKLEETEEFSYYRAFADEEGYIYDAEGSYLGTMNTAMLGKLLNGTERCISDNMTIGSESYILLGTLFSEPIQMGDRKLCIALLGVADNDLTAHFVLKSGYSGGYSSVIHIDGSYVIKNSSEPYGGLNVFSIIEKNYLIEENEMAELKKAIQNGETYYFSVTEKTTNNVTYLYFAPIADSDWYMENALPKSFINKSVSDLQNSFERVYVALIVFFLTAAAFVIWQQMASSHRLKKSQLDLEKALKTAEEASNAKTDFLFSMSHDIRTPMNAILGYTDIGLKHAEDAEISRDSYRKIKMAGGHLLNLINDILEMSRIESGKMELNEKPLDIRKAISDVTTMSQSLAMARSIDYETVVEEIRNPYIYADELHINEVIINIVSNAVKYTPVGGKVRYRIRQLADREDGRAVFRFVISDNGIGMSEEFQKHLFETFSREENTTMSKTEGTGLGLSIVKKIVDMADGEIRVDSIQNQGSTFTVEIPFRILDDKSIETFTTEKKKAEEATADVSFVGKRLLMAEDNELNREIATYILEDAGLEVDTAEDGSVAVHTIMEKGIHYYDFILMDIQMPVMNGYEATRKIREMEGGDRIPIIALSANAFEEDRRKSIEEGMNAHVAKPIDVKTLLDTMKELIK